MPTVHLQMTSRLSAPDLMSVLTDFSAARPVTWPTIDADHFHVHALGDSWAEVTEGTSAAWERARYEWDTRHGRVTVTTHESKVFGPGGGWIFQLTPQTSGTRVDIELIRKPSIFGRRLLAALLPVVARRSLRRSFAVALQAQ